MTNNIASLKTETRLLIAVSVAIALALSFIPALAGAATYAYVNTSGDVATVTATTPSQAILIAPNISLHSGVLLLDSPEDNEVIGDDVSGV